MTYNGKSMIYLGNFALMYITSGSAGGFLDFCMQMLGVERITETPRLLMIYYMSLVARVCEIKRFLLCTE